MILFHIKNTATGFSLEYEENERAKERETEWACYAFEDHLHRDLLLCVFAIFASFSLVPDEAPSIE